MKFGKKREKGTESAMWKYAKYAVVAVCVIGIGANSVSVIPTGYTGVKSTFGKISEKELTTGIHISVPFVQHIQTISNKQQDRRCEGKIWGETSDKTPVYGENVTVTYSISPEKSAWLCANVTDTDNLIKGSMVASAMKAAMAELAPEDVTNRGKIEPLTQKKLEEVLNTKYGKDAITLYQVIIENMDFEDEYNAAIQQKSIAQQTAARQEIENKTAIKKAEADKTVEIKKAEAKAEKMRIEAEAQANANKELADSISDALIDYQKIEKWDGKLPKVTDSNAIVSLDGDEEDADATGSENSENSGKKKKKKKRKKKESCGAKRRSSYYCHCIRLFRYSTVTPFSFISSVSSLISSACLSSASFACASSSCFLNVLLVVFISLIDAAAA